MPDEAESAGGLVPVRSEAKYGVISADANSPVASPRDRHFPDKAVFSLKKACSDRYLPINDSFLTSL